MERLGIDIGGSGIKGAPVDVARGTLLQERWRVPTPQPATLPAVAGAVIGVLAHFGWEGPFGCTFPGAIKAGVAMTAAHLDPGWVGQDARGFLEKAASLPVELINDADAAGLAEMSFGAGRGRTGVVLVITLGTGIGSALFVDGHLVPNTELGHLELDGRDAETLAADSVRAAEGLSWKKWSRRLDHYLRQVEKLVWPDLIILGGGVSKKSDRFLPHLETRAEVVPAALLNNAGIVGAAVAGSRE
jgi:polyphosphate glucokinase